MLYLSNNIYIYINIYLYIYISVSILAQDLLARRFTPMRSTLVLTICSLLLLLIWPLKAQRQLAPSAPAPLTINKHSLRL